MRKYLKVPLLPKEKVEKLSTDRLLNILKLTSIKIRQLLAEFSATEEDKIELMPYLCYRVLLKSVLATREHIK